MLACDNTNCRRDQRGVQSRPCHSLFVAPLCQSSVFDSVPPPQPDTSVRSTLAVSLAGFSCFLLLYGTQPLLPQLTTSFAISPGTASLSVTAGTGLMALLLIPLSLVADRYGRERLMRYGLVGAALFSLLSAWAPEFFLARAGAGGAGGLHRGRAGGGDGLPR